MKRMTLKQMQRALHAVDYISNQHGEQTRAQEDIEAQLKKIIAWAAFAQGFSYDPLTNRISEG